MRGLIRQAFAGFMALNPTGSLRLLIRLLRLGFDWNAWKQMRADSFLVRATEDKFAVSAAPGFFSCREFAVIAAPAASLVIVCAKVEMAHVERESQQGT